MDLEGFSWPIAHRRAVESKRGLYTRTQRERERKRESLLWQHQHHQSSKTTFKLWFLPVHISLVLFTFGSFKVYAGSQMTVVWNVSCCLPVCVFSHYLQFHGGDMFRENVRLPRKINSVVKFFEVRAWFFVSFNVFGLTTTQTTSFAEPESVSEQFSDLHKRSLRKSQNAWLYCIQCVRILSCNLNETDKWWQICYSLTICRKHFYQLTVVYHVGIKAGSKISVNF